MENDDVFITDARLDQAQGVTATGSNNKNKNKNSVNEESPLLADSQESDASEINGPHIWECQSYLDELPWYKRPSVCYARQSS